MNERKFTRSSPTLKRSPEVNDLILYRLKAHPRPPHRHLRRSPQRPTSQTHYFQGY